MPVMHDDREIELHDLLDFAKDSFGSGDFGSASCEQMAGRLSAALMDKYGRGCKILVLEDGEVGAVVRAG
jgi:hypothetical protein